MMSGQRDRSRHRTRFDNFPVATIRSVTVEQERSFVSKRGPQVRFLARCPATDSTRGPTKDPRAVDGQSTVDGIRPFHPLRRFSGHRMPS